MFKYSTVFYCLGILLINSGLAYAVSVDSEQPLFIYESLKPTGRAVVEDVESVAAFDVILLDGGLDQGFSVGLSCDVSRTGNKIAEIILVDVFPNVSAGLILNLEPDQAVMSGDTVSIQTLTHL